MKTAVYYSNRDIKVEECPVPSILEDEILVDVEASGICGSDLMEWYRLPKAPVVLGHEVSGKIVKKGEKVRKFRVGDRVVVTHHVPCNTCEYCLTGRHTVCRFIKETNFYPGGFAEYLRIPGVNVDRGTFHLPDNLSYEEGTFTEPLGCVVRGQRLAGSGPGKSVAVIGSGVTGLLNLQYAIFKGAAYTCAVDISDFKLKTARRFGADAAYHADDDIAARIRQDNRGMLADIVIVCAGVESAIRQALDIVEKGGTLLFFAPAAPGLELSLDFNEFWWSGVKLLSSYAAAPEDLLLSLKLLSHRRINVRDMITHRLPLTETPEGFSLMLNSADSLKVIINP